MYQTTIGLEVHIELKTKSKMFCTCRNDSQEREPNLNICPVCLGHPGVLPVINEEAIKKAVKTAEALNCQIQRRTFFERKNYFYPDLPKGYQISQYQAPLAKGGWLEIPSAEENRMSAKSKIQNPNAKTKKIRIERIHLEEDTGKLLHPEGKDYSLVDFNRAGMPLMELVSEPDICSGQEARNFVKELQLILRYLDVSYADMEKGEMRAEVNISLSNPKSKIQNPKLGTKVEIKNLNSLRAVEKSIEYEIKRQSEILEAGKKVVQETRGWHDKKQITFSQREKEESHDYRYFPEPDLPPLSLNEEFLKKTKAEITELPSQKRARFKKEYNLAEKEIEAFVSFRELGEYFEKVVSELLAWIKTKKTPPTGRLSEKEHKELIRVAANYLLSDLLGLCGSRGFAAKECKITPENFAEFSSMLYRKEISSKIAKTLLKEMFETGGDPSQIIGEKGLQQITDSGEIEGLARKIISQNPKPAEDYRKGKIAALQFLLGQMMKETKGKASPEEANKILKKLLS